MKLAGIKEEEIIKVPIIKFKVNGLSDQMVKLKYKNYEKMRQESIRKVIDKRYDIIFYPSHHRLAQRKCLKNKVLVKKSSEDKVYY